MASRIEYQDSPAQVMRRAVDVVRLAEVAARHLDQHATLFLPDNVMRCLLGCGCEVLAGDRLARDVPEGGRNFAG